MDVRQSVLWFSVVAAACGGNLEKKNSSPNNGGPNNASNTTLNNDVNNGSNNVVEPNNGTNNVVDPNNPTNNVVTPTNNVVTPTNNISPTNNITPTNNVSPTNNGTNNLPGGDLHIQLVWDTDGTDLDLHFAHPNASDSGQPDLDENGEPDPWLHDVFDCTWRNPMPDWGQPGPVNDPLEDIDDTNGFGPENINIETPESGLLYKVGVRSFQDVTGSSPSSTATVRIYQNGILLGEYSQALSVKDLWEVAWVNAAGEVTPISSNGDPVIIPNYSPDSPP